VWRMTPLGRKSDYNSWGFGNGSQNSVAKAAGFLPVSKAT
jgi:hypothetical protein